MHEQLREEARRAGVNAWFIVIEKLPRDQHAEAVRVYLHQLSETLNEHLEERDE